jgi:YidC/Oxa1 family membrane protein insertase
MDESVNQTVGAPRPPKKKELSMELRLLIAFILMGAVLFTTPYLYKAVSPQAPVKNAATAAQTPSPASQAPAAKPEATPAAAPAPKPAAAAPAAPLPASATRQHPEPPVVIETDLYKVTFSNHGATVRSWILKGYKGNDNKPLELTNPAAPLEFPFSLFFPGLKPQTNVNWAYFTQKPDADGLGVAYEFSDGHVRVRKSFRFQKKIHLTHVTSEVTLDGKPVPHLLQWRGGFGDLTVGSPAANQKTIHFDLDANKLSEQTVSAAKNGPAASKGNFSFAGLADTYFTAVFLPEGGAGVEAVTFSDHAPTPLEKKPESMIGAAVGGAGTNQYTLFVGPKDLHLLQRVSPKLEQVVNFGWLAFLAKPLFLMVNWFNNSVVHNYGWAIVIVTIFINFALFPLKISSMKSMRKMQALQPQIAAINDKYKNVGLRDPRKAEQNQEVMELYKKHGVNPMGGCMPMLLQIPFFFAFYTVFTVAAEMRGASWLWVTDLSQPEHLAIKILPITMIASQFWMQKMTPQANTDPAQQRMMMMMPLVFGFMFYNFPSGLVLYYLTSNLVSIGQQWFFNHTSVAAEAARSVQVKKKNGRK